MDQIEASTSVVAKKLWNIVRVVFIMMRKGLSKSKIMVEFHMLMKRGKLAGKALAHNFVLNHATFSASSTSTGGGGFGCRSNDAVSFISPREYEFSCSNSPAAPAAFNNLYKTFGHFNKRSNKHHYFTKSSGANTYDYDDVSNTVNAVQKVLFEMYNMNHNTSSHIHPSTVEASPLVTLPGFGKSPLGMKQLRITDSPFPLNYEGGDTQVDSKADDFIKRFYRNLKMQGTPARSQVYG